MVSLSAAQNGSPALTSDAAEINSARMLSVFTTDDWAKAGPASRTSSRVSKRRMIGPLSDPAGTFWQAKPDHPRVIPMRPKLSERHLLDTLDDLARIGAIEGGGCARL